MLHPTLETLLFLKIARNTVCESVDSSDIEDKVDLKNYIQNEASDFEIIHLISLDEMPEVKYDADTEAMVWENFRRDIVYNFDYISEGLDPEDINTIIFEMGPIGDMGYSSAAPIFEFAKQQGFLEYEVLEERKQKGSKVSDSDAIGASMNTGAAMAKRFKPNDSKAISRNIAAGQKMAKSTKRTAAERQRKQSSTKTIAAIKAQRIAKAAADKKREVAGWKHKEYTTAMSKAMPGDKEMSDAPPTGMSTGKKVGIGVGAAGVAAAGAYGAYKLYQKWKAKRAAAKTEKERDAATAKMKAAKAKMKNK